MDPIDPAILDEVLEPYIVSQAASLESLDSYNQPSLRVISRVSDSPAPSHGSVTGAISRVSDRCHLTGQ